MKSAWLVPLVRALLLTGLAAPAFANAAVTVLIDGAAYPAELRENTDLLSRVRGARPTQARHYQGELTGTADSWVRVSNIRGQWQGVMSLDGKRFVVDSGSQTNENGDIVLDAQSPSELMSGASCATESGAESSAPLAAELSSGVAEANLVTLPCQSTLPPAPQVGICLLAELDLTFDRLFQQLYPATFQDQAAALTNIVDGYYRNDMHIQFDLLSLNFLTTDVFSTTTVAGDLLTDISMKKNSGQLAFVTNPRAILHVVTGRNFDGTTIGISNVGLLCSSTDNAGTSQVVFSGALPSTGLTALVIAHELGHNFGASHDGTGSNTCDANGSIMSATLSGSASRFSSCSVNEMTSKINGLSNLSACFEFPVDAVLAAHPANPTTASANENFTLDYDISETHASVASAELRATGSFAAAGGSFVAATINGLACSVASDGQSYLCVTGSTGGLLEVTARVTGGAAMTIGATVAVGPGGGAKDIDTSNNSANQTVSTSTAPTAPSALAASAAGGAINLTWQDNSANEDGFRVERRTGTAAFAQIATAAANVTSYSDTTATGGVAYDYRVEAFGPGGTSSPSAPASAQIATPPSSPPGGGGGGGGSFGAELAPLLLALFALRRHGARAA